MSTAGDEERLLDYRALLIDALTERLSGPLATRPELADAVIDAVDDRFRSVLEAEEKKAAAPDSGLAELIGLGPGAARSLTDVRLRERVQPYDEQVASQRITGIADLYYLYQHERIGVFLVIEKLKELFDAGAVRLSSGPGAMGLYRFDRRKVLRYTERDRQAAYLRAFGYGRGPLAPGAQRNTEFHPLFTAFNDAVSTFWQQKRISSVINEAAQDPSFGSIAVVRRAGLDLRNNLKFTSYGNVAAMRVEVLQLLGDAFAILGADDVKALFGADGPWDVVEEVLTRYFGVVPVTSPRQRMAVTGRSVLRWLGQRFVLEESRTQFEAKLRDIADDAEEWLTSAQSVGVAASPRAVRPVPARRPVRTAPPRRRPDDLRAPVGARGVLP